MQHDGPAHERLRKPIEDIKIRHVHRPRCKRGVASAPFDDLKKSLDENARLYFFVKMHSEIVSAVGNEQQVCVTDADPSTDS